MNKVVLIGRMTRDAEVRYNNETGKAVARFSLAVDRKRINGQKETDFINCVAFDKTAENAEKYFKKGLKLCVSGRLQIGSFTNREGQRVQTADVIVEEWEFVESKANSENAQNANNGGYAPRGNNYTPKPSEQRREPQRVFEKGSIGEGFAPMPDSADDPSLPWN